MFPFAQRRRERREIIDRLYGAIVTQARRPAFYAAMAVPDTTAGRFDLIVLHVHLVFRRLAREGVAARTIGQRVFDRFVEDMDESLREMGIGDLAVPRRMRAVGEAFYGRAHAYESALAAPDDAALATALQRNVLGGGPQAGSAARALARYVRRAAASLAAQDAAAIAGGEVSFPAPEE